MLGRPVVALLLCVLVSGCCSAPFSAREVGDAPDEGGVGGRRVTVTVLEDGAVAQDAAVAVFWLRDGTIREDDESVALHVLRLRGPGTVTAWVPTDRDIAVAAATTDRFSEEWLLDAAKLGHADAVVSLDLYPRNRTGALEGTWSPAAVTIPVAEGAVGRAWDPRPVLFDPDPERNAGFADRLATLRAQLTWTNTQTATGDLGLTVGRDEDVADPGNTWDDRQETGPGTHNQTLDTEDRSPPLRGGGPLLLGPSTKSTVVAPLGLDYRVTYEAEFHGEPLLGPFCDRLDGRAVEVFFIDPVTGEARPVERDSPGAGLLAGLAAVAVALVLRCSRQHR